NKPSRRIFAKVRDSTDVFGMELGLIQVIRMAWFIMKQSKRATKRCTKTSSILPTASTYPLRPLLGMAHAQRSPVMDWIQHAKRLFNGPKPEHFTKYRHCCECAEHDETLLAYDVNTIGVEQLGNPGWDPLCFATSEGFLYYLPALMRITL